MEFCSQIEEIEDRNIPCPLGYLFDLSFDSFFSYQSDSSFDDTEYLSYEIRHFEHCIDFRQYLRNLGCRRQYRQIHLDAWNK